MGDRTVTFTLSKEIELKQIIGDEFDIEDIKSINIKKFRPTPFLLIAKGLFGIINFFLSEGVDYDAEEKWEVKTKLINGAIR